MTVEPSESSDECTVICHASKTICLCGNPVYHLMGRLKCYNCLRIFLRVITK
jgi:hypothetical protein